MQLYRVGILNVGPMLMVGLRRNWSATISQKQLAGDSNRRRTSKDYAVWEIHPVMKMEVMQ
jgi:hypothetical protein